MGAQCVLVVEHDATIRNEVAKLLADQGYSVESVQSSHDALDLARVIEPVLIVLNPQMPDLSGVEIALSISQIRPCNVLFLSPLADDPDFREVVRGLRRQGCNCSAISVPVNNQRLLAEVLRQIGIAEPDEKPPQRQSPPEPTGEDCPVCGKPLVLRQGPFGEFVSCSGYAKCKYRRRKESAPDVPIGPDTGKRHARAKSTETLFELLIEHAQPRLYESNAFRITGLPVDASLRDISRTTQKLEMIAKGFGTGEVMLSCFDTTPSSAEDIRAALQVFKDPERRLLNELFWFWPIDGSSADDPAITALSSGRYGAAELTWAALATEQSALDALSVRLDSPCSEDEKEHLVENKRKLERATAVAIHNLAVLNHIRAIANSVENSRLALAVLNEMDPWEASFKFWSILWSRHTFWEIFSNRIRTMNDPRVRIELAELTWSTLPLALLSINARLAIGLSERGDFQKAGVQLRIMKQSGFPQSVATEALRKGLKPLEAELLHLCETTKEATQASPKGAAGIVRDLLERKKKYLQTFNYLLGAGDPVRDSVHDLVAQTGRSGLVAYVNNTDDWEGALPVFEECLSLANSASVRSQLEEDCETVGKNAAAARAAQRTRAARPGPPPNFQAGSTAPSAGPAVASGNRSSEAEAQASSARRGLWVVGGILAFVVVIVALANSGNDANRNTTVPSTPAASESSQRSLDDSTSTTGSSPTQSPSAPDSLVPSQDPQSSTAVAPDRANSGPGESNTTDSDRVSEREQINRNKEQLSEYETNLSSLRNQLDSLSSEVDSDKSRLQTMKNQNDLGEDVDTDLYESIRSRYNGEVREYNSLIDTYNERLREYRALLKSTNEQVDRYNAAARSQ